MESIQLDLIDHIPSIVTIIVGVCAFLWVMFQTVVKKYLEESVSQGFRKQLSELELSHKHKFSLADEERKAIYDVNKTTTELVCFYSFLAMIPDNPKEEKEMFQEIVDIVTATAVAWEKLSILRLEFLTHAPLLKSIIDQFHEMTPIALDNSLTPEEIQAKTQVILNKIDRNEFSQLRIILNGYLKEISE